MLFYFTGTGNSKWVAERIAEDLCDRVYDLSKLRKIPDMKEEKQIGMIFPVYAWGVPEPMLLFAKKIKQTKTFTFGVCTCGADAGKALKNLSRVCHLDSSYSVIMPSNYIIGNDVERQETIEEKIKTASRELKQIAKEVRQQKQVYRVKEGALAALKSGPANWGFNRFARTTKPFYVTEQCNGCGKCMEYCPAHTIQMKEKRPIWGKDCFQCLRCINACPKAAIQYGKHTEQRGRYLIQNYLKEC